MRALNQKLFKSHTTARGKSFRWKQSVYILDTVCVNMSTCVMCVYKQHMRLKCLLTFNRHIYVYCACTITCALFWTKSCIGTHTKSTVAATDGGNAVGCVLYWYMYGSSIHLFCYGTADGVNRGEWSELLFFIWCVALVAMRVSGCRSEMRGMYAMRREHPCKCRRRNRRWL